MTDMNGHYRQVLFRLQRQLPVRVAAVVMCCLYSPVHPLGRGDVVDMAMDGVGAMEHRVSGKRCSRRGWRDAGEVNHREVSHERGFTGKSLHSAL